MAKSGMWSSTCEGTLVGMHVHAFARALIVNILANVAVAVLIHSAYEGSFAAAEGIV